MTKHNTKGEGGGQQASGIEEGFARALVYLRVSTKEQAEMGGEAEGFSIPAQRAACLRKAESLGAVVVEEFVDRGESAKTANRPELARMLVYLRENHPQYVIVHKVDRLARNRADDVVITMEIKKSGATLVSCSENIDETPSGLLLHGIMSSIAEFYSRNLATEVSKGMVQKAMSGGTIAMAPVGYLHVRRIVNGREMRTIEVDPERAPHVKWAFETYATGEWTLHQLTDELDERGLRSRPGPRTTARRMVKSAIHKMLRNPYYIGIVTLRGVAYEGKHPQLVSKELFERVQGMLDAHKHAGERQYVHNHYLKGSLYCGICGRKLAVSNSRSHTGRIYDYYYCLGRQSDIRSCTWKAVRVGKVERLVIEHYRSIQLPPQRITQIRHSLEEALVARRAEAEASEHAVTLRIQRLTDERRKLLHLHYAEAVPVDLFKQEQKRIAGELDAARQQLADVSVEFDAIEQNLKMALTLARDCHAAYEAADENTRRLFNQAFFEKLYVHVDGEITHNLAEPFGLLLDPDLPDQIAKSHSKDKRSKARKAVSAPGGSRNEIDLERIEAEGSNVDTVVRTAGLEPAAFGSVDRRSDPTELRAQREESIPENGAGGEARGPPGSVGRRGSVQGEASDDLVVLSLAGLHEAERGVQGARRRVARLVAERARRALVLVVQPGAEPLDGGPPVPAALTGTVHDETADPAGAVVGVDRPHDEADHVVVGADRQRAPHAAVVAQAQVAGDGGDELELLLADLQVGDAAPVAGVYVTQLDGGRQWRSFGRDWRRSRDSNPGRSFTPLNRLAGGCLQPLGHFSARGD